MAADLVTFAAMYTLSWDSTGNPLISTPIGFAADGLPLSLQVAGRPFEETAVLRAADAYQRATDWHLRAPVLAAEVAGV